MTNYLPKPKRVQELPPLELDSEDEFKTPQKNVMNNKQINHDLNLPIISRKQAPHKLCLHPRRVDELPPLEPEDDDHIKVDYLNCALLNESFLLSPTKNAIDMTFDAFPNNNNDKDDNNNNKENIHSLAINKSETDELLYLKKNLPSPLLLKYDTFKLIKTDASSINKNNNCLKDQNNNAYENNIFKYKSVNEPFTGKSIISMFHNLRSKTTPEEINTDNNKNNNDNNNNNNNKDIITKENQQTPSSYYCVPINDNNLTDDNTLKSENYVKQNIYQNASNIIKKSPTISATLTTKASSCNASTSTTSSSSSSSSSSSLSSTSTTTLIKNNNFKLKSIDNNSNNENNDKFFTPFNNLKTTQQKALDSLNVLKPFQYPQSLKRYPTPNSITIRNTAAENQLEQQQQRRLFQTPLPKTLSAQLQAPQQLPSTNQTPINFDNNNNNNIPSTNSDTIKKSTTKDDKIIEIKSKSYLINTKLGAGGSSSVYFVKCLETNCNYALKIVDLKGDAAVVEGYLNETKLLAKLQGNINVVALYDYVHIPEKSTLYMIMEKGDSDLDKILQSNKKLLPTYKLIQYLYQILQSVNYIHANGIIHSDLKPANFLMVNNRLKLIDFGIASNIATDSTSIIKFSQAGTFNYISPEALIDTSNDSRQNRQPKIKISTRSDVWSLGCILYLFLYQKTPFAHIKNIYSKISTISNPDTEIEYLKLPSIYPSMLLEMTQRCLQHNPKKRPTVSELLKYPFHMIIPIETTD